MEKVVNLASGVVCVCGGGGYILLAEPSSFSAVVKTQKGLDRMEVNKHHHREKVK